MLTIKSVRQALNHRARFDGISHRHSHPSHRLHDRPMQPDGNHQGGNEQDARGGFHYPLSKQVCRLQAICISKDWPLNDRLTSLIHQVVILHESSNNLERQIASILRVAEDFERGMVRDTAAKG